MKKTPLRIAVIGAGRWGANIIRTLDSLPDCEVAYIVSLHKKTLDSVAHPTAKKVVGVEALLQHSDIDAVCIATPGTTHADIALKCIERHIPTFIEKPMTTSLADAKRIVASAKKHNTPVFVGHIHLYNPAYNTLRMLVPKLGKLRFLIGEGCANGPYRPDMSALWDWAPHDIAMMLDLTQARPTSVQAWGIASLVPRSRLYDVVHIKLDFPHQVTGFITNSWLSPIKKKQLTVIGEKSTVVFDDASPNKLTLSSNMGPGVRTKGSVAHITRQEPVVSHPSYQPASSLTLELEAFIASIQNGTPTKTDAREGLMVVAVLDAAERSIQKNGSPQKISV